MKIIYGNIAPNVTNLDALFIDYLLRANDFEKAVEMVINDFKDEDVSLWTCNPLIPNYLDDDLAKEIIYIWVDERLIKFGDDPHLCKKLTWCGPGEALADDGRVNAKLV